MNKTDEQALKRYALGAKPATSGPPVPGMWLDDDGDWVKLEDVQAALAHRDAQLAAVTQQLDELVEAAVAIKPKVTRWWFDGSKSIKLNPRAVMEVYQLAARIQLKESIMNDLPISKEEIQELCNPFRSPENLKDWLEGYILAIPWSNCATDYEKTLVEGNLRNFVSVLCGQMTQPKGTESGCEAAIAVLGGNNDEQD